MQGSVRGPPLAEEGESCCCKTSETPYSLPLVELGQLRDACIVLLLPRNREEGFGVLANVENEISLIVSLLSLVYLYW